MTDYTATQLSKNSSMSVCDLCMMVMNTVDSMLKNFENKLDDIEDELNDICDALGDLADQVGIDFIFLFYEGYTSQ